jgi:uncharacterized protein with HEPN domain
VTYEQFLLSTEKQDSVLRRLEIIGEAVKGIPTELRTSHPGVPWREIAGTRFVGLHALETALAAEALAAGDLGRGDLPAPSSTTSCSTR